MQAHGRVALGVGYLLDAHAHQHRIAESLRHRHTQLGRKDDGQGGGPGGEPDPARHQQEGGQHQAPGTDMVDDGRCPKGHDRDHADVHRYEHAQKDVCRAQLLGQDRQEPKGDGPVGILADCREQGGQQHIPARDQVTDSVHRRAPGRVLFFPDRQGNQ